MPPESSAGYEGRAGGRRTKRRRTGIRRMPVISDENIIVDLTSDD